MTDLQTVVKLDDAGHVCGVTRMPREHGAWIAPPVHVARDPFSYMRDASGAWIEKTAEDQAAFDALHALPDPAADTDARIAQLKEQAAADGLTQDQVHEAVGLLLDKA